MKHLFISPAQCPHLPSLQQAILRLAFSSFPPDFTKESRPYTSASWSHGIVSLKCPLLKRPPSLANLWPLRNHSIHRATSNFSQFCCASVKWSLTGQNGKILSMKIQSSPATAIFVQKPEGQSDWDTKNMHWKLLTIPTTPHRCSQSLFLAHKIVFHRLQSSDVEETYFRKVSLGEDVTIGTAISS